MAYERERRIDTPTVEVDEDRRLIGADVGQGRDKQLFAATKHGPQLPVRWTRRHREACVNESAEMVQAVLARFDEQHSDRTAMPRDVGAPRLSERDKWRADLTADVFAWTSERINVGETRTTKARSNDRKPRL